MQKILVLLKNLLILLFFCSVKIHAVLFYELDEMAVLLLQENKDHSVLNIQDGNVYLDSDKIVISRDGMFLKAEDNCLLKLANIHSDAFGIYTSVSKSDRTIGTVWPAMIRCRNCDLPFSKTIFNLGVCPRCGTQN